MLHVILQILAVIGIILLCILGLLLLIIALILFVPIRYRVNGKRYDEEMELSVKVTYLLHLLTVRFDYPDPSSVIVRLLGIKLYDSKQKMEETSKEQDAASAKEKSGNLKEVEDLQKSAIDEQSENLSEEKEVTEQAETLQESQNISEPELSKESEHVKEACKEKRTLKEKIQYTFHSICDKIKNIIQKIKDIFANISYYKEVLLQIENQRMYGRIKNRMLKALKSIRPRTIKAQVHFGTGSPDTTAYIYGIYSMLQPVFGKNVKNINIVPDFEETVYEGTIFLKGKITIFMIAIQAIKVLLDKQVQKFIKQLKREA